MDQKLLTNQKKKSVANQIIGIFVLVLVISVIVGMTFLFTSQLKTEVKNTAEGNTSSLAYKAVNKTEFAGYTTTRYITLVFLAMIFSAVLLLVLRMILPYMNLGQQMGGGW